MSTAMSAETVLVCGHDLTPTEREQGRLYLQQSKSGISGAIKCLSDKQWSFSPGPGQWSIALIVEHVLFVLERVGGPVRERLTEAAAPPAGHDYRAIDSIVINQFSNRLAKFPAPEMSCPSGGLGSPGDAVRSLANAYRALSEFLDATPDLREHALESAPLQAVTKGAYDFMDGYQWILAAAAHAERHTKQILEVAADDRFPLN